MKHLVHGFTLIELMVCIAVLAIMSTLATPSLRSMIGTMNAKSASFDLIGDLAMARTESLKRNVNATVAPVNGNWVNGWSITTTTLNGATEMVRSRQPVSPTLSFTAPAAGIVFLPNGRVNGADNNLSWAITSSVSGVTPRCVIVTPSGTARSKTGTY